MIFVFCTILGNLERILCVEIPRAVEIFQTSIVEQLTAVPIFTFFELFDELFNDLFRIRPIFFLQNVRIKLFRKILF